MNRAVITRRLSKIPLPGDVSMNTKTLLAVIAASALFHGVANGQLSEEWGTSFQAASESGYSLRLGDATSTARLNQLSAFLADQLTHNRTVQNLSDGRIAIASFVTLPSLNETDKVGLALEERLMHEMQSRGFRIVDYKISGNLKIREAGDFAYSRNVGELRNEHNVHYLLTGVIENSADGYAIHARLVDASDNLLVSSAQAFLDGRDALRILGDFRPVPTPTKMMMVVGRTHNFQP